MWVVFIFGLRAQTEEKGEKGLSISFLSLLLDSLHCGQLPHVTISVLALPFSTVS